MVVKGEISNIISWNGWFYGIKRNKKSEKYYKSRNVRFDDTCGGTEEITEGEYHNVAEKYTKIFN